VKWSENTIRVLLQRGRPTGRRGYKTSPAQKVEDDLARKVSSLRAELRHIP